jgi:hypothetical protein
LKNYSGFQQALEAGIPGRQHPQGKMLAKLARFCILNLGEQKGIPLPFMPAR